ncbi:DUF3883 domain-containing protein [Pedobacter sp. UYP1]|uniref:sacsin N-terminal ATP-binding-like domain-containing protein n=1 Tax=Pedobacter sp. UYP1 TaxID=1756396 RepID=UPI00339201FA
MEPAGVHEDERELLIEYYIQKVSGRLRQLKSPNEYDQKRWVWELLQNAKDSISKSDRTSVDVEVEVQSDRVIFRHNGEPFTPKAMNSLIWQKSGDKRGVVGSSGRFGTGFLTTHTLSETVSVKSNVRDINGKVFSLLMTLHREGETDEELQSGIEKTLLSRTYSLENVNQWTEFTYLLKNHVNRSCAIAGLESLESNVFYNLAFTPEINTIRIIKEGSSRLISRKTIKALSSKISLQCFLDDGTDCQVIRGIASVMINAPSLMLSQKFKQERRVNLSAAIEIEPDSKTIIGINSNTPSLFCVFPLIGSEDFNFPVVLNSIDFEPIAERERLLLDGDALNEEGIATNCGINQTLLKYGLNLYSLLLKYFSAESYKGMHYLAVGAGSLPKQNKDFDRIWYKNNIQTKIRSLVLSVQIVETSAGLKKINNGVDRIFFPKSDSLFLQDIIWEKAFKIMSDSLPLKSLSRDWSLLAWEDDCELLTLEVLVEKVSLYNKMELLPEEIVDKVEWVDELITLVQKNSPELLQQYAIIPTEDNNFHSINFDDLSINEGLKEEELNILLLFDKDWSKILVKKGILGAPIQLKQNEDSFLILLNGTIRAKTNSDEPSFFKSVLELISYQPFFDTQDNEDLILKRTMLYDIALSLFGKMVPEKKQILNPREEMWEQADICLSKKIVSTIEALNLTLDISSSQTVSGCVSHGKIVSPIEKLRFLLSENLDQEKSEQFVLNWLNSFYKLMTALSFSIGTTVPSQTGYFKLLEALKDDKEIPNELKEILLMISPEDDYRNQLIHQGLEITPLHSLGVKDIAKTIDDIVKTADKDNINDSFLEGVKLLIIDWFNSAYYPDYLYIEHRLQTNRDASNQLFSRNFFEYSYQKREFIEINMLWTVDERKDFQKLRKVLPNEVRKRLLAEPDLLENHGKLQEENQVLTKKLEETKVIFDKYPELTLEKLDRLMELKALSEGWNTDVNYSPDDFQKRINFENGWKGEAYVYKELVNKGLNVYWPNKATTFTQNVIVDYVGETHYIQDQGHKYDLVVTLENSQKAYIQVKSTVTDIDRADEIALPISTREWKFISETQLGEQFILARVFSINETPELYFMHLTSMNDIAIINQKVVTS